MGVEDGSEKLQLGIVSEYFPIQTHKFRNFVFSEVR